MPGADPLAAQFPTADLDNAVAPPVGDALERGSAPGDGLAGLELPGETAAGDAPQTPPGALDAPPVSAGLTTSRPVPVGSAGAPGSQDVASETVVPQAVSAASAGIAPASAGGGTLAVMPAAGAIVAGGAQPLDSSGVFASPPAPFAFVPMHSIGEDNLEELIDHLNRDGEQWEPGAVLHVGFPQSLGDDSGLFPRHGRSRRLVEAAIGGLSFFSGPSRTLVMQALGHWADVANITFTIVEPGEEVDIYFYALEYGGRLGGNSSGVNETHGSRIVSPTGEGGPDARQPSASTRSSMKAATRLGLDHPGTIRRRRRPDDELPQRIPAGYGVHRGHRDVLDHVLQPRRLTGYDANGTDGQVMTPRTHDIYVMQQLYGVNWDTRAATAPTATTHRASASCTTSRQLRRRKRRTRPRAAHHLGRRRRSIRSTCPATTPA